MRPWILQDIIVYSTSAYPYSGKVGREYVPFCAVQELKIEILREQLRTTTFLP